MYIAFINDTPSNIYNFNKLHIMLHTKPVYTRVATEGLNKGIIIQQTYAGCYLIFFYIPQGNILPM